MKNKSKIFLRWLGVQSSLICAGLLIIEIILRWMGNQPGDLRPNWLNFQTVDSLYVVHDYYLNDDGILIADSLLWSKYGVYINSRGFRTDEFSKIDSSKKKVIFIGDSFTWGTNAIPLDSCFVDIIRKETNFEVINLGIPTADPVQYFELAKKYVPIFKPNVVFVMFFTGNDIMKQDRKAGVDEPFYYFTNAGAIIADLDGKHFDNARSAYHYFIDEKYYLTRPDNIFEYFISKSALLSRLYSVRFRIKEKIEFEHIAKNTSITKKYLNGIRQICAENKIPMKFVAIPEIKEADMPIMKFSKKYSSLFNDDSLKIDWIIPQNSKNYFNDYPDAHLNNRGHRFYADYLKSFLNAQMEKN